MANVLAEREAPIRTIKVGISQGRLSESEARRYEWGRKIDETLTALFEKYSAPQVDCDISAKLDASVRVYKKIKGKYLTSETISDQGRHLAGEAFERFAFKRLVKSGSECGGGRVLLDSEGVEVLMNVMYPGVSKEYDDFGKRKLQGHYVPDYIALQRSPNGIQIAAYYDATISQTDVRHSVDPQKTLSEDKGRFPGFFVDVPHYVMVFPRQSVLAGLAGYQTKEHGVITQYRPIEIEREWPGEEARKAIFRMYVTLEGKDNIQEKNRFTIDTERKLHAGDSNAAMIEGVFQDGQRNIRRHH